MLLEIKRIIKNAQYILICTICLFVLVSLISSLIENTRENIQEMNNEKSNHCITFNLNEDLKNEEKIDIIHRLEKNKNIVLRHSAGLVFESGKVGQGIFFNNKFIGGYNLLEGRFFNIEDFNGDGNKVVVGKDILKTAKTEGNNKYIYRNSKKYMVIGVIGKKNIYTRYDDLILYNLNNEFDEACISNFPLEIDSKSRSEEELKNILASINLHYSRPDIEITEKKSQPNPLNTAINSSKYMTNNFLLIILCVFLSLIKAISYWIEKMKLEIGVRKSFGATNTNLCFNIILKYGLISLISIISALLIQKLLMMFKIINSSSYYLSYKNLVTAVLFSVLLGIIFIIIAMNKINQIRPVELLKGN